MRSALPIGLLLLFVPGLAVAALQPIVLHDADRGTGYVQANSPLHYGHALLNAGEAEKKKGSEVSLRQGDHVWFEADAVTTYPYDGFAPIFFAMPPGPFLAKTVHPLGSASLEAEFLGEAFPLKDPIPATLDVSTRIEGGRLHAAIQVLNGSQIVAHSDAWVEIRRADGWLVFRTHLHTHTDPMSFEYAFPSPGSYEMRVVAYNSFPTGRARSFEPLLDVRRLTAEDRLAPPSLSNLVRPTETAPPAGDDLRLRLTVDPQGNVAPFGRFEFGGYVYEASTESLKQHVDFEGRVVAADGRVLFSSKSLHEYDGYYDLTFHWPEVGSYVFELAAKHGTWSAKGSRVVNVLTVLPPERNPQAASGGPVIITAEGLENLVAGQRTTVRFHARTLAGTPSQHAEIDFQIRRPDGLPHLQTKIHTHDTGDFQFTLTLPAPGRYTLVLDPVNLHGEPIPAYHYGSLDGSLSTAFDVGGTAVVPVRVPLQSPSASFTPSLTGLLALGVLCGIASLRRLRQS